MFVNKFDRGGKLGKAETMRDHVGVVELAARNELHKRHLGKLVVRAAANRKLTEDDFVRG